MAIPGSPVRFFSSTRETHLSPEKDAYAREEILWVSDGNAPEKIFEKELTALHPKVQVIVNQAAAGRGAVLRGVSGRFRCGFACFVFGGGPTERREKKGRGRRGFFFFGGYKAWIFFWFGLMNGKFICLKPWVTKVESGFPMAPALAFDAIFWDRFDEPKGTNWSVPETPHPTYVRSRDRQRNPPSWGGPDLVGLQWI